MTDRAPPIDVLIVDDSATDRMLLRDAFAKTGAAVTIHECSTGEQALDFLNHRAPFTAAPRPQVCLVDISMPGLSGLEVLEAMKRDEALRALPVIIISNSDRDADIAAAYEGQASAYIHKPLRAEDLEAIVAALCVLWGGGLVFPGRSTH